MQPKHNEARQKIQSSSTYQSQAQAVREEEKQKSTIQLKSQSRFSHFLLKLKQKYAQFSQIFKQKINKYYSKIPVFNPFSQVLLIWEILQIVSILVLLFVFPLVPFINIKLSGFSIKLSTYVVLIDFIVRINTGFFQRDTFIKSRKMIIKRYIKSDLFYDMMGVISIITFQSSHIILEKCSLLILCKVQVIQSKFINIESTLFHNFTLRNIIKLFKLIFAIFIFSHFFACAWIYTGRQNKFESWIIKNNLQNEDWNVIYVKSIFFSLVTMVTIGYGDITPVNYEETIFCSLVMILACGMFGYSLNQIGRIFEIIFRDSDCLRENIALMNTYMEQKQITSALQFQIRQYLTYYWNENKATEKKQQTDLIKSLSVQLQQQLLMDANKLVLKEVKILSEHFSETLMKQAVNIIKELNSTPDEVIFSEGELSNQHCLYFIEKGRCEVYLENKHQVQSIKILNRGDYFGSYSFFTGNQRLCGVRSKDFCTLLYITRQDFLELCKQHLLDYEKFCFIKDKLQYENDFQIIDEQCYNCKEKTHIFKECPKKHFNIKGDFITFLTKESQQNQAHRVSRNRKKYKYRSTLLCQTLVTGDWNIYYQRKEKELDQYINDNFVNTLSSNINKGDNDEDEESLTNSVCLSKINNDMDASFFNHPQTPKTPSQFSRKDKKSPFSVRDNLEQRIQQQNKLAKKPLDDSLDKILSSKNMNEQTEQSKCNSPGTKQKTQDNLIDQFSSSNYFQSLIQQSLDKRMDMYMRRISNRIQTQNNEQEQIKLLQQAEEREKKLKEKQKGVNKIVDKAKRIMKIKAKSRKKFTDDIEQTFQEKLINQTKTTSQLAFYLLQQKNIQEQSYTQEFLLNEFEHMYNYKMYYPNGNYDIMIKSYNISNIEKNLEQEKKKPLSEQKKNQLNNIDIQLYQNLNQSNTQEKKNQEEMLSLVNHYRGMQYQKKKTYIQTADNQKQPKQSLLQSPQLCSSDNSCLNTSKKEQIIDLNSSNIEFEIRKCSQSISYNPKDNPILQKCDQIEEEENIDIAADPVQENEMFPPNTINSLNRSVKNDHQKYLQE